MMTAESLKVYTMAVDDNGRIVGPTSDVGTQNTAGEELDRLAREYVFQHPEISYRVALRAVMDRPQNQELVQVYGGASVPVQHDPPAIAPESAAKIIDQKAREFMDRHGCKDYSEAVHAVLGADPELSAAYAAS